MTTGEVWWWSTEWRTPFSRMGTELAACDAGELGRVAVTGLLARSGIDPAMVDETILGCVGQPADQANLARVVALRAGIPEEVPAMTVHRNCASGLEALFLAHQRLVAGQGEVFVVGGTESMSNYPLQFRPSAVGEVCRSGQGEKPACTGRRPGCLPSGGPLAGSRAPARSD